MPTAPGRAPVREAQDSPAFYFGRLLLVPGWIVVEHRFITIECLAFKRHAPTIQRRL